MYTDNKSLGRCELNRRARYIDFLPRVELYQRDNSRSESPGESYIFRDREQFSMKFQLRHRIWMF